MMGIVYSVYKILELFLTDCKRSGYDHDTPAMTLLHCRLYRRFNSYNRDSVFLTHGGSSDGGCRIAGNDHCFAVMG